MKTLRPFLIALTLLFGSPLWAETIDINTADAETLKNELAGVGPTRAKAIIAYREKHGPFKRVEDLLNVEGIGNRTVATNRENIVFKTK
jgi:competence protein ComEA